MSKMNEIEYFICKRCGIRKMKSPLHKDGMCDSCNRQLHVEKFKQELDRMPSEMATKYHLHILNVNIQDYTEPVICEDYVLIKVDDEIREAIDNILALVSLKEREQIIPGAKFLVVTNVILDQERANYHLYNVSNTFSCEFSRVFICGLDLNYFDWKYRILVGGNSLNISIENINQIVELRLGSTKKIDFEEADAKFILNKILQSNGNFLFRGINNHYHSNDGIAASIYRNNPLLVKYEKLQDHEKEVVDKLLSKDFYQPNTDKKLIYALTDLRHSGKDTCLLDFSENPKIALFFCCFPSQTSSIGEILILEKKEFEFKEEVSYPHKNDFLIKPAVTENTGNRVAAQKSVFLYCHKGFFPRNECEGKIKSILIAPQLKPLFFSYSGRLEENIYPDFHGFIENQENFNTEAKLKCKPQEEATNGRQAAYEINN